jgi:hypothetical protein
MSNFGTEFTKCKQQLEENKRYIDRYLTEISSAESKIRNCQIKITIKKLII